MAISFQCTFDATDPHRLAGFWASALGYQIEDDDDLCRRMLDAGYATTADVEEVGGRYRWRDAVALSDPDAAGPRIYIQRVPEPKVAKNRFHPDLRVGADRRDTEISRLEGLGARRLYDGQQGPLHWVTMADPEGNEFCIA
jgi:hypothetical protein